MTQADKKPKSYRVFNKDGTLNKNHPIYKEATTPTQADWVKELRELIHNPSVTDSDLIDFVQDVESLAQQRTEKKWRDCLDLRRDGKVYVEITKLKEISDLLK